MSERKQNIPKEFEKKDKEHFKPDIRNAQERFLEIAYIKDEQLCPMDLCPEPLRIQCISERVAETEKLIPGLAHQISEAQVLASSRHEDLPEIMEINNVPQELRRLHIELLGMGQVPLFLRLDSSLTNNPFEPSLLPPSVEIQFRIGGLGFHTAADQHFLGKTALPSMYADTLRNKSTEMWGELTPKVLLLVPEEKAAEVRFWANELSQHGVSATTLSFDGDNPTVVLDQVREEIDKGARIIVRREVNLPLLSQHTDLVEKAIGGEILFEPPLPIFFDGKAISLLLSRLPDSEPLKHLSVPTQKINNFGNARELVENTKKGVLKFGSGMDLPRTFGGRGVAFLDSLSNKYKAWVLSDVQNDLKKGQFWIFQEDFRETISADVVTSSSRGLVSGRVRSMFFVSVPQQKIIGGGFNIGLNTQVVRGGHPIGTIDLGNKIDIPIT